MKHSSRAWISVTFAANGNMFIDKPDVIYVYAGLQALAVVDRRGTWAWQGTLVMLRNHPPLAAWRYVGTVTTVSRTDLGVLLMARAVARVGTVNHDA